MGRTRIIRATRKVYILTPPYNIRRIYSSTKDLLYFVIFELDELKSLTDSSDDMADFPKRKEMAGEICRSLLKDISQLADVDRYSGWRQKNSEGLSGLVQARLAKLQNSQLCNEARELVCNYSSLVSVQSLLYVTHVMAAVMFAVSDCTVFNMQVIIEKKISAESMFHGSFY